MTDKRPAVVAIETYRSPAEIPAQYNGALSACGVVLLWLESQSR